MPKVMAKKVVKKKKVTKAAKKTKAVKKPANAGKPVAAKPIKALKPIGVVTHFFNAIKVAIIKVKQPLKVGTEVIIRGATTDFKHKVVSMQYDHEPIAVAKKGQEVGIKVAKRVREGDEVFLIN